MCFLCNQRKLSIVFLNRHGKFHRYLLCVCVSTEINNSIWVWLYLKRRKRENNAVTAIQFNFVVGFKYVFFIFIVFIVRFDDIHICVCALKPPKSPINISSNNSRIAHKRSFVFSLLCIVARCLYFAIIIIFYCFECLWFRVCVCSCECAACAGLSSLIFHHRYERSGEWCWRYDKDTVSHTMRLGP